MEMPFHNKYNTMKIKPERINMFFIVTGLVKVVKQLISLGADVNWRDKNGRSALTHACISGNTDIIKEIISAGCNMNNVSTF